MSSSTVLLCSILFLCLLEEGAHGWLQSDVVGSHYTNAMKQTQTVELFRLIIVLVSLRVATSYLDYFLYCLEHPLSYRMV